MKSKTLKRVTFVLILVMLLVLATATVIEKMYGTATAHELVYNSWPFFILWALIGVTGVVAIVRGKLHKRPAPLALHLSLLLILAGAAITWTTAERGKMQLSTGQTLNKFTTDDGQSLTLPFGVTLREFTIKHYQGTQAPMDFESDITVTDADGAAERGTVSMNKVFSHRGYRFYQSGYDAAGGGTVLAVSHDPWGIAVTYTGYLLLLVSMVWLLVAPHGPFRRLLRNPLLKQGALVLVPLFALWAPAARGAAPRVLPREVAQRMGDLYILYNDRVCPFQTFARDFTAKLCGNTSYEGFTAEQVATGWIFYYDDWKSQPMIKVKSAAVRHVLGIQGRYASLQDFDQGVASGALPQAISRMQLTGDDAGLRAMSEADERYQVANMAAAGTLIRIFPLNHHGEIKWYSQGSMEIPADIDEGKWAFLRHGMDYLYELVSQGDWQGSLQFIDKLKQYQLKECAGHLPSPTRIGAEKCYNAVSHDRPVAMLLTTLGIVCFVLTCWFLARNKRLPRAVTVTALALLALSELYLTLCMVLRWTVSGHVPVSNGFETMQFMAWATLLITLLLQRRMGLLLPFGLLTAGLALMVASFGESNPQITLLMPVLASPLLSIHVVVIMIAYSLFSFLMLGGIMAVALRRQPELVARLHALGQVMLLPAVMLLAAGIFIGAVWANVSWGTYWSWDPKEVWALITLLVYALPLHAQSFSRLRRPLWFHIYCIAAFLTVVITYFGVNFLLGGMHSYA